MFDCIRFAEDKDKLRNRVLNNPEFNQLSEDSYDLISCYTKVLGDSEIATKYKQGGKVIMCKGMKDLLADERAEGKAEGIVEGKAEGMAQGMAQGMA